MGVCCICWNRCKRLDIEPSLDAGIVMKDYQKKLMKDYQKKLIRVIAEIGRRIGSKLRNRESSLLEEKLSVIYGAGYSFF